MNDYPTIISFYTKNWEYPKYAEAMRKSCANLGLESHIKELPDTGDWLKNTAIKPFYIYETLIELKRPILWIDVDGSIMKRPELLKAPCKYDFAARKKPIQNTRMWHVGTMYFNYNDVTVKFLEEWNAKRLDVKGSDELALDLMWKDLNSSIHLLNIGELPTTYFEMLKSLTQSPSAGTIVCHRASKGDSKMRMKKRIKEKEHKKC